MNIVCAIQSTISSTSWLLADKPCSMAPGVYTYKFQCDLPKELPTSCEEKFGFIRYLASVHIVLQPLSVDKVHSVAFTVIKPYNLNAEPIFQVSTSTNGSAAQPSCVTRPKTNTSNVVCCSVSRYENKQKEICSNCVQFFLRSLLHTVCHDKTTQYQIFPLSYAQTESTNVNGIITNVGLCARSSDSIAIGCAK